MRSTSPRTSVMQSLAISSAHQRCGVGRAEGEEAGMRPAVERVEQLGLAERACRRSPSSSCA